MKLHYLILLSLNEFVDETLKSNISAKMVEAFKNLA